MSIFRVLEGGKKERTRNRCCLTSSSGFPVSSGLNFAAAPRAQHAVKFSLN